jgi:hypothetical protein
MKKLPRHPNDKLESLIKRMAEHDSVQLQLSSNVTSFDPDILVDLSKMKHCYFVASYPTFTYDQQNYEVGSIMYSDKFGDFLATKGELFCFYSTYQQGGRSFIRGQFVRNTSHLLADDRDEIIDSIIDQPTP